MPQSGLINTRTKPRVTVLRGFDPNSPMTLTQSLPVATSATINSGQVIKEAWASSQGSYVFSTGYSNTAGKIPFIALQDSADEDVTEAGKLTGLSCAGQFEIQTAYYNGSNIAVGDLLTASATAGDLTPSSATGQIILGHVTRAPIGEGMQPGTGNQYAPITISPSYTGGITGATGPGAVFYPGIDSSAVAPATVLTFATAYNGFKSV